MHTSPDFGHHPCFNAEIKGLFGRVHLPVAPRCNILCNYCNRKYDCVNESRPGVTSTVLSPSQAVRYLEIVVDREPRITVAGIAGPGDPFANAQETLQTMRKIRACFPNLLLCLATNGLNILPYVRDLAEIGVSHVTLTVNAVKPEIGARIYRWVREGKTVYRGERAASLLLGRQLEAIKTLKELGIVIKVNTVVIPGVNDSHILEVARKMGELGVDLLNCMALYPNQDTPFQDIPEPTKEQIAAIRQEAGKFVPQMHHCTRCRADAVGLLHEDRTEEFRGCLRACSTRSFDQESDHTYVAVASQEGMLVNQHLGEARRFLIFGKQKDGFTLVETRPAPLPGGGRQRWLDLAEILKDCRAVLVSDLGDTPRAILEQAGIRPVVMHGFIAQGLQITFKNGDACILKRRRQSVASAAGCAGTGLGCG
ncbi:MAG: radical SAM protein [Thermodesulfobacteriota bacterium]